MVEMSTGRGRPIVAVVGVVLFVAFQITYSALNASRSVTDLKFIGVWLLATMMLLTVLWQLGTAAKRVI